MINVSIQNKYFKQNRCNRIFESGSTLVLHSIDWNFLSNFNDEVQVIRTGDTLPDSWICG